MPDTSSNTSVGKADGSNPAGDIYFHFELFACFTFLNAWPRNR